MDVNGVWHGLMSEKLRRKRPRIIVIGAGSRGTTYARVIDQHTSALIAAVAEPIASKRAQLGKKYIWKSLPPSNQQAFASWEDFLNIELERRRQPGYNQHDDVGINAALICTLDTQHAKIINALAPLKLHILCEKPLATNLDDCLAIYRSLRPTNNADPFTIFAIAHVLRYTPHNILLRRLLLDDRAIGDILSVEHTEPVGHLHFSHSYVRGNWRNESTTAPSLLTKSCHDIDFLLWMLGSSLSNGQQKDPRRPKTVTSTGHLAHFKRSRKPATAGMATNCTKCSISKECMYSATKVYDERYLAKGHTDWPIKIVDPEIEDIYNAQGPRAARARLMQVLAEDYGKETPDAVVKERNWFGRCVWESDNNVCDDQTVTMIWNEDEVANKPAISATFHMIAMTEAQCARRGRVYGTEGEISYDSSKIEVTQFASGTTKTHTPSKSWEKSHAEGGHGGGDEGLAANFVSAVEDVLNGESVLEAQQKWLGATLDDIVQSHAMVFAAEEARRKEKIINWDNWWLESLSGTARADNTTNVNAEAVEGWQVV